MANVPTALFTYFVVGDEIKERYDEYIIIYFSE
jgi:hypothetical protein